MSTNKKTIIQKLYSHARAKTYADESDFMPDCVKFALDVPTNTMKTQSYNCADENTPAKPKMFPLWDFIRIYAPPEATTDPKFNVFDEDPAVHPSLFCDFPTGLAWWGGPCEIWSPGRRSIYGQMAKIWITDPPNFVNTGLSDYTVT